MRRLASSATCLPTLLVSLVIMVGCAQAPTAPSPATGSGWLTAAVGGTTPGRTEVAGGEFRLRGSGDVSLAADQFHYTYRTLNGDGAIQARLLRHTGAVGADAWPKAGIMVRSSLDPAAPNALLFIVDNVSFQGAVLQERAVLGGGSSVVGAYSGAMVPHWLRLEREGTSVRGLLSTDGDAWSAIGSATVALDEEAHLGLVVASGDRQGGAAIEVVFDAVSVEGSGFVQPREPGQRPDPQPAPNPGPQTSVTYEVDAVGNFLNPERGWHQEVNLLTGAGFGSVRSAGSTLARSYIRLDEYRYTSLPPALLDDLAAGLAEARVHGIKIILRFSYNFGWEPDAPLDSVLGHIRQLAPLLTEYEDVIVVLQAGFIGAWGEWHSSTYGLLELDNKRAVTSALLDALPESRMIQIRTPGHIRDVVGSPSVSLERFSAEPQARVGFKNDCFISSENDAGTFLGDQLLDRFEAATLTQYTVMGGETCAVAYPNPRNSCEVALRELEEFHFDYLNSNWYNPVTDRWRSEGCYEEVTRRLGYRLSLSEGSVTAAVPAGDTITVHLSMTNTGFGKVFNPRPIEIVLRDVANGLEYRLRVTNDGRAMLPMPGETRVLELSATVPADLPGGEYRVLLNLPDAALTLENDARYSIRLANVGTWDAGTGYNDLRLTTTVGP